MRTFLEFLREVMVWLFPNGIGAKAALAFIIVGYGVTRLDPADLKEVVFLVITAYFVIKAANGQKRTGT